MRRIRLTESQLNRVIMESAKRIIRELDDVDFDWQSECDSDGKIRTTISTELEPRDVAEAEFECTYNDEDDDYVYATAVCVGGDLFGDGYTLDIEISKFGGFDALTDAIKDAIDDDEQYMSSRGEY